MDDREARMAQAADAMERFHALMGDLMDDMKADGLPPPAYGAIFSSWSYLIGDRMNTIHSSVKPELYGK